MNAVLLAIYLVGLGFVAVQIFMEASRERQPINAVTQVMALLFVICWPVCITAMLMDASSSRRKHSRSRDA